MLFLVEVCKDENLKVLMGIIKSALVLVQIVIPIALIIWGTIDLGKAVIASDEKKIKESQQTLMKRALAAVLVFVLATLVGFLMGIVGSKDWKECWTNTTVCEKGIDPITGGCKQ